MIIHNKIIKHLYYFDQNCTTLRIIIAYWGFINVIIFRDNFLVFIVVTIFCSNVILFGVTILLRYILCTTFDFLKSANYYP